MYSLRLLHTDSGLPSVHSLAELVFIQQLGHEAGWFSKGQGVYLGGQLRYGE